MKTKYLLIISLFVILMSMTGISASENVNQTDSLGLSVENNFETEEDEREIIRQKPDEVELKENENGSIYSNILAVSNEDEILGKDIYVTGNTFESISNAINGAEAGDIIYLSGTYKNNWKKHIEINKYISIIGINDATLDAQGHSRIFYVTSGKINIQNIVFKNGNADYGGAIYFENHISNSNINATFINNKAKSGGGAIYIDKGADNCDFTGNFTDNFASTTGGAINIAGGISYCNFDANFINNNATAMGGAVLVTGEISNANFKGRFINNSANMGAAISLGAIYTSVGTIGTNFAAVFINNSATGDSNQGIIRIANCSDANIVEGSLFINNTAESLIYMDQIWDIGTRTRINNNIFIENDCNYIIRSVGGSLNVDYNWLGHTKDNYTNKYTKFVNPDGGTFYYSGWLFLNATADSTNPAVGASSTIRFKLSYYDSDRRSINSNYDNKNLPSTDLTLTSTKGNLNQRVADLNESFSYSPTSSGEGSVTAGIGDVKSTIKLNNTKGTIGLTSRVEDIIYPDISIISLRYNELATGTIDIQLTGNKYNLTYTNLLISPVIDFKGVLPDYYSVKISYSGDDNFYGMVAYDGFWVHKGNSNIKVYSHDCYINDSGALLFWVVLPRDANGNLTIGNRPPVNVTEIGKKDGRDLIIKLTNDGSWSPGQHNVTFFYSGEDMFKPSSTNASCNIFKIPTEIIAGGTIDLFVDNESKINYILKPDGATGEIKFISDNPDVVYVNTTTGVIKALNEGNANIKIQFTGGDYDDSNATVTVTVSRISTEITLANSSFALKVDDVIDSGAGLSPSGEGNLTYASSDEGVVKVVDGKLVAVGVGSAVINVSFAGDYKYLPAQNKTISVSVSLINASVSADDLKIYVGGVAAINPVTSPGGLDVLYTIADKNIADVDPSGNVIGINKGTTSITITINGKGKYFENSTRIMVTVSKIPTVISVENKSVNLFVEDSLNTGAALNPQEAGNLTYTSSDENVAIVKDGKIIALKEGEAIITVSFAGNNKYFGAENNTINVTVKLKDASVSVNNETLELFVGDNFTIVVTTVPQGLKVKFDTGGDDIIKLDDLGHVTAFARGNATIAVSVGDNVVYKYAVVYVNVTVNEKPVPKENLTMHANAEPITVGEDARIIVTGLKDATGDVSLIVNGKTYTSPIRNGGASVIVSGLKEDAVGQVLYSGDDNYNNASASVVVVVNPLPVQDKKNLTIKAGAEPITVGENATVKVTGLENASGDVSVIVDGKIFTAPIKNGESTVTVSGMTENVTAYADYVGDDNYNPASASVKITVKPKENATISIDAPDVTKYFKGSERFVVTVTDYKGNPLANKSVAVVINGVKYARTTNTNGTCSIALNLPANVYNITTTVDNATINSVVTILTTVNGTDLVKVFRNATQYYATLRNSDGKYLAEGSVVRFNINGVMYDRKVTANGLAKLNINLEHGNYIITAINTVTGEMSSNNITVIPRIIENSDLTKYYRNATHYTVKIIGDDGKAVGAGESVTFNINGVFYTRQTNASGIVKLNINLEAGDYIITAEYKNCRVSNNIKVLPVLIAEDLSMKYMDGSQFKAKLVDGKGNPYPKQTVTFNINGVFYNRVTDSDGQAKLNIRLMAGEYIITSSYNGCNIANKITIRG